MNCVQLNAFNIQKLFGYLVHLIYSNNTASVSQNKKRTEKSLIGHKHSNNENCA